MQIYSVTYTIVAVVL